MNTDAIHADRVSASLGLVWLLVAVGFVVVLGQGSAAPQTDPVIDVPGLAAPDNSVRPVAATSEAVHQEQKALTEFIAKRWRIAEEAASRFVSLAYRAGEAHSVDPVLILAVMAVESGYNPVAQSGMGAKGLMQVIPRFHLEKLSSHGGEERLLDPEVNIYVGAQILREYSRRLRDEEMALQMYGGAFDDPRAQYAGKVFAERARLEPIRQKARQQTAQSA